MKILILATNYPNLEGGISLYYIHTRIKSYIKKGIDLDVLNFSTKKNYKIDNVNVITMKEAKKRIEEYSIVISHAPNIRNHYMFLKKYNKKITKIIYFFHGHEIVKINEVYPKPYDYNKKNIILTFFRNQYDIIKLKILKIFFNHTLHKSHFIFVSNSLYKEFLKYVKIDEDKIKRKYNIIHNSVGEIFETQNYDWKEKKEYDFITIRSNLDSSVYCIDIINNLAKANKNKKFLIVGRGGYFKHNKKSENITVINKNIDHKEIIKLLNKSKCALMPTRRDTQGLMACEMATYGIPLITSDIPICHEIFKDFTNVYMIKNNNKNINLDAIIENFKENNNKCKKYFKSSTSDKEIDIIKSLYKK